MTRDVWDLPTAPYSNDDTSKEAAESMEPLLGTLRREVFEFFRERGDDGATDEEAQHALALDGHTETPRRWELSKAGLVVDSGLRRKTSKGRNAIVWVVKRRKPA